MTYNAKLSFTLRTNVKLFIIEIHEIYPLKHYLHPVVKLLRYVGLKWMFHCRFLTLPSYILLMHLSPHNLSGTTETRILWYLEMTI